MNLIKKYKAKNLEFSNEALKYLYNGRDFIVINNDIDLEKFNYN